MRSISICYVNHFIHDSESTVKMQVKKYTLELIVCKYCDVTIGDIMHLIIDEVFWHTDNNLLNANYMFNLEPIPNLKCFTDSTRLNILQTKWRPTYTLQYIYKTL